IQILETYLMYIPGAEILIFKAFARLRGFELIKKGAKWLLKNGEGVEVEAKVLYAEFKASRVPLKALGSLDLKTPHVALEMSGGRGAWKGAGRGAGLQWRDSLIYVVKDKKTGELLKVGETGSWESRFGEYLTRAKNEGREIVIDIWKIEDSDKLV